MVVPGVPELGMHRVWNDAIQINGFMGFIPDDWEQAHHRTDRRFFYGILATIAGDFVEQLVLDSR